MVAISDPRYALQWHFGLIGDIATVWDEVSGQGVRVGVYDDGMDQSHEDLAARYDASLHYAGLGFDDGQHNSRFDGHGTAIGGLIAADRNGVGGIGVAWGARLTAVDFLNDLQFAPDRIYDDALAWTARFDVVNMSYGVTPDFDDAWDIGDPGSEDAREAAIYAMAAGSGRGGLGTVFVKAAGNGANDAAQRANGILGNAQGEGQNNLHTGITVGAVGRDGWVRDYSNYGANLLISAPAASHTTDVTGAAGYAAGNYNDSFGGTSAATAVISGVVALMLEAEPGLGARDVRNILAASAAQSGSDFGDPAARFEAGAWQAYGGEAWNGGALTYSPSYGYGLVDAFAAVRLSETWLTLQGGALTEAATQEVSVSGTLNQPIRDHQSTELTLTVAGGIVIEHAYVTVELTHARAGDLTIELVAPDGSVIPLAAGDGGDAAMTGDWTFGVAALRGMDSGGPWAVRVSDGVAGHQGTFVGASLELRGSAATADDIWIFTDDFPALAAVDPARATATDSDGGSDWINTAAVARDTVLTLGGTSRVSVGGAHWADISGQIENAASGDGDDVLTGGAGDNHLMAGRGRDLLTGGAGADRLEGGAGGDVLQGGGPGLFHTAFGAQVYRLYLTVLGREPDLGGHQDWTSNLTLGKQTLLHVVRAFTASPEFLATYGNTSNADFTTLLYRNALLREPDSDGLTYWVTALDGGMSRSALVMLFSESPEHKASTAAGLAAFDAGHDITTWADDVYRLYRAIFDRDPDPGGYDSWTGALAAGQKSFAQVVTQFMAAPEFTATYGAATTDAEFVTLLYENVLKRMPDGGGLSYWITALEGGASRVSVVTSFMASPEFVARTVPGLADFIAGFGADDALIAQGDDVLSGGLYADHFVFAADGVPSQITVTDLEPWDVLDFHGFGASAGDLRAALVQQGPDVVLAAAGESLIFLDTALAEIGEIYSFG